MENKEVTVGRNNSMYSFNPKRVGHIVAVHIGLGGVVHMAHGPWALYTYTLASPAV
jgi:hypothetical protein